MDQPVINKLNSFVLVSVFKEQRVERISVLFFFKMGKKLATLAHFIVICFEVYKKSKSKVKKKLLKLSKGYNTLRMLIAKLCILNFLFLQRWGTFYGHNKLSIIKFNINLAQNFDIRLIIIGVTLLIL